MDVQECMILAMQLTEGRKDYRGRDWWHHDVEVMNLLPADATDDEKMAALLHSVLDILAISETGLLEKGVPARVVEIVRRVTNGPTVKGYAAYVNKCREVVASRDRSAIRVKLADMKANRDHPTNDYTETIQIMEEGLSRYP